MRRPGSTRSRATCASIAYGGRTPWQELPPGFEETDAACDPLPDEAVSTVEERRRIESALARLPPEQHEVVALAFLEGLSHSRSPSGSPSRWAR